ncbi:MAG: hypothetical protein K2Q22_16740, partial [Cytophagales bacterium]|nr:hypothetical protein [Cytophagales bacterium]
MKRVGLFFDRTYVDAHYCFTELARKLSESGYYVDLYYISNPSNPSPTFFSDKIRVLDFPVSRFSKIDFWYKTLLTNDRKYSLVIATPIFGLLLAQQVAYLQKIPLYYLADEVFDPDIQWHYIKNFDKVKAQEKRINQFCAGTLALGDLRYAYQKQVNQLPDAHRHFILPNSSSGPAERIQTNFLRDLLGLHDEKPIVLFIGTMHWKLAKGVWEEARNYSEQPFHLVFHMRTVGLNKDFEKHPFIHYSGLPMPQYLMNYLVSSASIGLVLYDKEDPKEARNGWTGGKIGTYLKNCIPLIAGNL